LTADIPATVETTPFSVEGWTLDQLYTTWKELTTELCQMAKVSQEGKYPGSEAAYDKARKPVSAKHTIVWTAIHASRFEDYDRFDKETSIKKPHCKTKTFCYCECKGFQDEQAA
jgi:hypothetical protein